jgi:hypothetical protein
MSDLDPAAIITGLLRDHRFLSKGARDCTCGWSGGQMWPTIPHEEHVAQVISDHLAAVLAAAQRDLADEEEAHRIESAQLRAMRDGYRADLAAERAKVQRVETDVVPLLDMPERLALIRALAGGGAAEVHGYCVCDGSIRARDCGIKAHRDEARALAGGGAADDPAIGAEADGQGNDPWHPAALAGAGATEPTVNGQPPACSFCGAIGPCGHWAGEGAADPVPCPHRTGIGPCVPCTSAHQKRRAPLADLLDG